jgi:hypothetical protein
MVEIQYVLSPDLSSADAFLRGEDIAVLPYSNSVFDAIVRHIHARCQNTGNIDLMSGRYMYEGYLTPMSPS